MRGGDPRNNGCGAQRGELVVAGRAELIWLCLSTTGKGILPTFFFVVFMEA